MRILFTLAALFCSCFWSGLHNAHADQRPNFVVVLADDLGYGDLHCYGGQDLQTPRIDDFAAGGLKFTDCYAAHPNCSPSRAGLMTGRTPFRVGIYNWIPVGSPMHVRRSEITIAALLRNSGYDTCHVGKWHLNGDLTSPQLPQPSDLGFNHWYATQNNALPNHRNPDNFVRNAVPVGPQEGYSAQLVAGEAQHWLEHQRDSSRPFFLFACFHEPHEPIASAKQFTDLYSGDDPSYAAHHGNISQLDAGFGTLLDTLDRLQLRDNTFIFFTSDNGPAITGMHPHGSAGPLRDKKGTLYEGGIRVPGIVQWPGKIQPGSVSSAAISGVDVLPTLCELAGIQPPTDRVLDGTSFVPALRGQPLVRKQPLYWQFNRSSGTPKVAIRSDNWKLLASLTTPDLKPSGDIAEGEMQLLKTAALKDFQLYDLKQDVAESQDVANRHPEVMARLQAQMQDLFAEIQQAGPEWPAWKWPRYESSRIQWPEYWLNRKRTPNRKAQK